ncbi:Rad52/Rad22 family DNA repair protein [Agrobacterium sp. CCNWLW32]|uniref:Rad52/Rad22 family DNA repair protein n=1 Tax=Agrobacterium sp. CCNWLW32 TaxID=3122072 RepID=UPI00300F84DD
MRVRARSLKNAGRMKMDSVSLEQLRDLHRPFNADQVHWRAQMVTKARGEGYAALALAYLDARDVMDRLDQVCTPAFWQSEHFEAGKDRLGCRIGIFINGQWVWKSDGAGDTDVEAEKGAFSSALKRAAVSWGIGRYLYDLGNTWVPCEATDNQGKPRFKKFTENPWDHVRNRAAFLPKLNKEAA